MLPKDYDKLLFNKLAYEFSVMSAGMIKTDLELVDKKDYFYFSYKTKVWIYHAETKMDFIYYFGVNEKSNEVKLDDARLILKISKNNKIYSNSLLFVKNNFYIAKDGLLKNYPNLNFKGFEEKKLKTKTRSFGVIKLGEIKDAIMNLEKLVLAIPGPIKGSCKTCGESISSNKIKQDNIINYIQKSHPDMCGECIEKIIACEFLNKISPYLNQHTQSLEMSKKDFGNDVAFEYCLNLVEKFNLLYYFGYDKSLFSINSDNKILKKYSKLIDKDNLLIDNLIAIIGDEVGSKNVSDDESLINEFINLKKRGMNNKKIINYLKIPESKIKKWCDKKNRKNKKFNEFYYYYTLTIYEIKSINKKKRMKEVISAISSGKTREDAARIAKIPLYKIGQWFEEGKSNLDKLTVNFYNDLKKIEGNTSDDSSEKEYDEPKREIFDPIPEEYSKNFNNGNINKSGIAWVRNESGSWCYERSINGVFIQIRDKTLEGLYKKVIKKGLVWGIRDYDKAKEYLNIPRGILLTYSKHEGNDLKIKDEGIFKPISKEFRDKFNSMNSSGIAWVNHVGNKWSYNKQKNKKAVRVVDENLYNLYLKVVDAGLPWGIRDYELASKYLYIPNEIILKYSKELDDDSGQFGDNTVDDIGIYSPLSWEYEVKFSGINKTGIAWTNCVGNQFVYSKRENGKDYRFTSYNIYDLYSDVVDAGLPWGIRDYDMASKYFDIPEEVILKYSGRSELETDDEGEIDNSEGIYRPLSKEYENGFSSMNESGIAWVNRMGTLWAYVKQKNKKVVRLVDGDLYNLYLRVVDESLPWGIRDYDKASKYLDIPEDIILKYSKDEIDVNSSPNDEDIAVDEGIYQPISKEYENGFSSMNESGIAWVNRIGTQWSYKKQKNNKIVQIADYNLRSLYLRVVDAGLPWGIRDYDKASKYLDIPEDVLSKYSNGMEQSIDDSEIDVIDDGIYKPFPKEYEHLFKSTNMNKSGIAWVNMPSKKWEYSRNVNGKPIRLVGETLEDLYIQVIKNNLLWGIRDYDRAKNYLNIPKEILSKYSTEPESDISQDSTQNSKYDFNINSFKSNNLFNVVVTGLVNQEDLLDALNIFKDFKNFIKRINTTSINNSVDIFIELSMDKSSKSRFERFILDLGLNFNK